MKTITLVDRLEKAFESPETVQRKPETLAQAVSDSLLGVMPRLSSKLLELQRRVRIKLTDEQKQKIGERCWGKFHSEKTIDTLRELGENAVIQKEEILDKVNYRNVRFRCMAKIPSFSYVIHPNKNIEYKGCASVLLNGKLSIANTKGKKLWMVLNEGVRHNDFSQGSQQYPGLNEFNLDETDKVLDFGYFNDGKVTLKINFAWRSPFKLNASADTPDIPESFIELGDEAIAAYYDHVRKAPRNLRRQTSLEPPSLGILWSPTPQSLYVTGKIPKIEPPKPRGDPSLVLDIPDGDNHYKHVVAVWDIGQELPFRNWLTEYSEGSTGCIK